MSFNFSSLSFTWAVKEQPLALAAYVVVIMLHNHMGRKEDCESAKRGMSKRKRKEEKGMVVVRK